MRTGANFARGSCRALKWMLVLGALSVLGGVQAMAQSVPTIVEAKYTATGSTVVITMSEAVHLEANADGRLLPAAFQLEGGKIGTTGFPATLSPFRIDGLQSTATSADDSFTLVFDQVISTLVDTAATNRLSLIYDPDATRDIVSRTGGALAELSTGSGVRLVGPEESGQLRLTLERADKTELQKARMRGTAVTLELPAATGPPGATITYTVTPESPAGLTFSAAGDSNATPPVPARSLRGTLPNVVEDFVVVYAAQTGSGATLQRADVTFAIKVADKPDAVTDLSVVAAGPSSLKVTWKAGDANNAAITLYKLQYRAAGAATWLDALVPESVAQSSAATKSYTIEGLAPGNYQVQVLATNALGDSPWALKSGNTGAGPGKPTLTLDVEGTIPEDRVDIPVTVTATVPPSASDSPRTLTVTLTLGHAGTTAAEDRAELPNRAGIASDLAWDSPHTDPTRRILTFTFNSNLSSEATVELDTMSDPDAEDETFRITASTAADPDGIFSKATSVNKSVMIDDDEVQEYTLQIDDVALESSGMFDEGHGDEPVDMRLIVSPARTRPKSFFLNLESAQDASDYSLSSGGTSSGGPTAVSLRIDVPAGVDEIEDIALTAASNDGDRVDDTITLQMFETSAASPTTAGDMIGDAVMLTVVDQHKLPTITMGPIMVDGAAVTSLKEGETGTVTLMADRGTATDDVPDGEKITVALTHGAASSASAADYSLSSEMVTISGTSGTFMLEVLEDDEIDAEELVLQGAVTGVAMYGDAADMVALGPISFMDGTTKLVYPKTDEEIQAVIYPAKEAGMGDDMMFNPGETIEIAAPGSLFNTAEGVTLSFTAESDMEDVATVAVSGSGMVTVTAQDMAGVMAHITITAHASVAATAAKGLPQTDPSEASVIFPVEVGLEALSFTLMDPEDMNVAEGMSAMVTATASRAVTADVTINLMRDRAASTAGDDDYMAEAITIEAGMMSGTTMVMAVEDNMAEEMEELVLYGMAADNAGEVTGEVKLYLWDATVPALPIIAQLLLGLFLAIGGFRRYLRR